MPAPYEYEIPGDISTAMNFIVAALVSKGSEIRLERVLLNPTRTGAVEILRQMGAKIEVENEHKTMGEPIGDLIVRESSLRGIDTEQFATASYIDEIPILAVAAAFSDGESRFRNVGELRVKESDRLQGIINILRCFGVHTEAEGDDLIVGGGIGGRTSAPRHLGDHRLAMAIEVLNLATSGKLDGSYDDVIGISSPEFYDSLRSLMR
jgi:3-phosphoshikimate 1-carboxyvinyltransferase